MQTIGTHCPHSVTRRHVSPCSSFLAMSSGALAV